MTFKHVKFQDSVVMRSLERVAKEKGLVKEEDLVKNAALTKKADITPTNNLLENLIRLGAGLREAGFTNYADEVEERALAYKQAQSLYEAHKETGDDLIDAAHPDGSHKMEDVEGDAVFKTILDKHVDMVDVVEKKPTGKLASSKDILGAVKNVLGQASPLAVIAEQQAKGRQLWQQIDTEVRKNTSKWALQWSEDYAWGTISGSVEKLLNKKPETLTVDNIELLSKYIKEGFEFVSKMNNEDLAARLQGVFKQMFTLYGPMRRARDEMNSNESSERAGNSPSNQGPKTLPEVTIVGDPNSLESRVSNSLAKINSYKSQIAADLELTAQQKAAVSKWLDGRKALYNSQLESYKNVPEEEKTNAATRLGANVSKLDAQLKTFYDKWIA